MQPRDGIWKEVGVGVVIRDPKLKHWLVVAEAPGNLSGQRYVQIMSGTKELRSIQARPDDEPVVIMESSEPEAIMLLGATLGAAVIRQADDETLPLRAMRFRTDPIRTAGSGGKDRLRSHIDIHHGVYVGDNWAAKKVKQLVEEHEEMHSEEHMTMTIPHHHAEAT